MYYKIFKTFLYIFKFDISKITIVSYKKFRKKNIYITLI